MLQAGNIRVQLQRHMEKLEIKLVSVSANHPSFYANIRMALVKGYFMQVAHKGSERCRYTTVKDNQVRGRKHEGLF